MKHIISLWAILLSAVGSFGKEGNLRQGTQRNLLDREGPQIWNETPTPSTAATLPVIPAPPPPSPPLLDESLQIEEFCANSTESECAEKVSSFMPKSVCGPRRGICFFFSDDQCKRIFNRTRGPCDDDEDGENCLELGRDGPCSELTSEECMLRFHYSKGPCAIDEMSVECVMRRDRRKKHRCRGPCFLLTDEECVAKFNRTRDVVCDDDEASDECLSAGRGTCGPSDEDCEDYLKRRRGPCYLLSSDDCMDIFKRTKGPCDEDEDSDDCANFGHIRGPCFYLTDEQCAAKFDRNKGPCDDDEFGEECMIRSRRRGPCGGLSFAECFEKMKSIVSPPCTGGDCIDDSFLPVPGRPPRPKPRSGLGFGSPNESYLVPGTSGGGFGAGGDDVGNRDADGD